VLVERADVVDWDFSVCPLMTVSSFVAAFSRPTSSEVSHV